ncbi:MAG: caspase family protein [Actinobacteria bacterium]|nr:MAG: caspase family protein [Actinomycetota bacterium]
MGRPGIRTGVVAAVVTLVAALVLGPGPSRHSRSGVRSVRGPAVASRAGDPVAEAAPAPPAGDLAITPPPDHFDAPVQPVPPPPASLQRDPWAGVVPAGGTWAVVVGIDHYPGGGHDLRSAVNDAKDVDQALALATVPADHRLLIQNSQATAAVIASSVDWLAAHSSPDAVAVFFYAGHVRKLGPDSEAVVAADGGLLTDTDLAAHFSRLRAGRAWIGMATCYGAAFTRLLAPGRVLTAAAGPNQLAYENESFGRSYLVEYMVRQAMIEGRAPGAVQSAFGYARAAISRDYPGREPVEIEDQAPAIELRPTGAPAPRPSAASSSSQSQAPPPGPGPSSPSTTAPPSGGGSGSGGSEPCRRVTLGVVRCGP